MDLLLTQCDAQFSAIITILQIGNAGHDPLIRYTALLSMICALMSLLYGCMYIIRFPTMQKTHKAAEWAFVSAYSRRMIFGTYSFRRRQTNREARFFGMCGLCLPCPQHGWGGPSVLLNFVLIYSTEYLGPLSSL